MHCQKTSPNKIQEITRGVVNTITDLILLELMVFDHFIDGPRTLSGTLKQVQRNLQFVEERRIKNMFGNARIKKWIDQKGLLTELGKAKINSQIPQYKPQKQWNGTWLIAAFDIPEKQRTARNIFRSYLKAKKFGKLQESVWISTQENYCPEIENLIETHGLRPFVYTFFTKNVGAASQEQIAETVWKLSAINIKYKQYIKEYSGAQEKHLERIASFLAIAYADPQLPKELLPTDWQGERAFQIYSHILERRPS
ncbi:MAG: hypothetical protein HYU04_00440 [Candidatus Wildermuthbacteria bacterium]|nr:hypothetical protein [Candidatus Wildermuthbacteria bacterium]